MRYKILWGMVLAVAAWGQLTPPPSGGGLPKCTPSVETNCLVNADSSGNVTMGNTVFGPVGASLSLYDDFARADTAAGVLGTPTLGSAWELRCASMATPCAQTNISSGKWVSAAGNVAYALQTLPARPNTIGAQFSFTTAGGTKNAVLAIGIGRVRASIQNMIHCHLDIGGWAVERWVNGSSAETLASGSFSPTLSMSTSYVFEVSLFGNTLIARPPQGAAVTVTNSGITALAGPEVFWEHYYANTDAANLLVVEKVWAKHDTPALALPQNFSGVPSAQFYNASGATNIIFRTGSTQGAGEPINFQTADGAAAAQIDIENSNPAFNQYSVGTSIAGRKWHFMWDGTGLMFTLSGVADRIKFFDNGVIKAVGYQSSDGTAGMTGSCASTTTITVKNGLITGCL